MGGAKYRSLRIGLLAPGKNESQGHNSNLAEDCRWEMAEKHKRGCLVAANWGRGPHPAGSSGQKFLPLASISSGIGCQTQLR